MPVIWSSVGTKFAGAFGSSQHALRDQRRELANLLVDIVAPAALDGVVRLAPTATLFVRNRCSGEEG
jgi:hypothetical protein